MDRFLRLQALLGKEKLQTLHDRTVTVVGIGAVGGFATEALARSGIGSLRLVDFDTIEPTNINRQILALESTVGNKKVAIAKERIAQINPQCEVEALPVFARDDTIQQIFSPKPDLIIDAIDALNPKTLLLETAFRSKMPIISSMGAALRTDPSQVKFGDLFNSHGCPLAKHLRKRLRRRGIERGIPCVYSHEKVVFDYDLGEGGLGEDTGQGRRRNVLGSMPTIPGIFGLIIANQAILALAEKGEVLVQS